MGGHNSEEEEVEVMQTSVVVMPQASDMLVALMFQALDTAELILVSLMEAQIQASLTVARLAAASMVVTDMLAVAVAVAASGAAAAMEARVAVEAAEVADTRTYFRLCVKHDCYE